MLVKQPVCGSQHAELGAPVQRIARVLLYGLELEYVLLGKRVALVKEIVNLGQALCNDLGPQFSVAYCR